MDSDGEPKLSRRRLSVEAKMHITSMKVRINSTTTAWPAVVLLLSCQERERAQESLSDNPTHSYLKVTPNEIMGIAFQLNKQAYSEF